MTAKAANGDLIESRNPSGREWRICRFCDRSYPWPEWNYCCDPDDPEDDGE